LSRDRTADFIARGALLVDQFTPRVVDPRGVPPREFDPTLGSA
jgi:hypothetical protein